MLPLLPAVTFDMSVAAQAARLCGFMGPAVTVLSPHSDDAPYSVAGVMRALAVEGIQVGMLTLFSRSDFAPNRPGLGPAEATALRLAEDVAAGSLIDPRIRVGWLDLMDAPLRLGLRGSAVVSREPFDPAALALADAVADVVAQRCPAGETVLAPLGLGWHIDHRIAAQAGVRLSRGGRQVHFYEDLPYAGFTRSSRLWLAQARRLRVLRLSLRAADVGSHALIDLKRDVFDTYVTQANPGFWSGLERQTQRRGGAERLWLARSRRERP